MKSALLAALICALPLAAHAGPFAEFEGQLRTAYADYRTALFASNSGKAEATVASIAAFSEKWAALETRWSQTVPPQYEEDPAFFATLDTVDRVIADASAQAVSGQLTEAHETLEQVRDQIGALHLRNGIVTFSDRMNAYHARMEEALAEDLTRHPDGGLAFLHEEAAVLAFLAEQIATHPAPEALSEGYEPLLTAMRDSVSMLLDATRKGDLDAAKAALGKLKAPYSKFFVKFG
ncbi:hypothetical protein [Oceanicola sp. 22II-s10i]|uniref:hypothetical protein n=1 Tax=Oceanicola sp. 22II-s10i TaxID=1317116 RepID=UPI000B51F119|nr:hypothetical protein [Oceanicola sp. 22II-s10i]